ncbi:MAG TPA: hypothetical protein VIM02_13280 [Rhizomicrobium sp.]
MSLSIAEVTALAEHGAVIPNVYVRNVKKWERAPYASQYEAILNLPNCIANGEITDAYFDARTRKLDGTDYREFVSRAKDRLSILLSSVPVERLREVARRLIVSRGDAPDTQSALIETLAAASANNFGYLRVLGPDYLYRGIEEHLETPNAERIVEAFGVIRASKHVFASPLTAALGGLFICPNFAEVIGNLFIRPEHSDQAMDRIEQLRKQAPLLQFLYERVSHIHRQEYQTLAGAAPPLAVLVTKDFRQRTQMIWEMQRAIARSFAQDGKVEEPKLDDLRCLYQDRARMITSVHTTVETIGGNLEKPIQIAHAMGELLHWCTFGHPTGHSYVQDGTLDFAEAAALEASRMADLAAAITFHWPGDRSLFYRRTVQLEELARS